MILVDPRVGSKELLPPLSRLTGGRAVLESLPSGDFAFEGCGPDGTCLIGIERKAIGDMMSSIRSQRFVGDQLVGMSGLYQFCYLVVEGIYRPGDDGILQVMQGKQWRDMRVGRGRFMYAELDNLLASLEVNANLMVRRTATDTETAFVIADLYRWWQKEWDRHHGHEAIKHQGGVTLTRASLLRRIASELPGIGWTRSKAVESHFPSVKTMITATEKDWQQIEGIGSGIAKKVVEAVRKVE